MSRLRRPRGGMAWPLLLSLCWVACSRPGSDRGTVEAGQHPVPGGESGAADVALAASADQEKGSAPQVGVPFHDFRSLPAGTLLTVRLKNPISSDSAQASGTFAAVVDEPVVIEGTTVLPRGANVAGRVESARASRVKPDRGYVRLSLDQVDIAGRDLPIRTSSLFARGKADEAQAADASSVVRVEQGRLLTFRLTEPVDLASQPAIPER